MLLEQNEVQNHTLFDWIMKVSVFRQHAEYTRHQVGQVALCKRSSRDLLTSFSLFLRRLGLLLGTQCLRSISIHHTYSASFLT